LRYLFLISEIFVGFYASFRAKKDLHKFQSKLHTEFLIILRKLSVS